MNTIVEVLRYLGSVQSKIHYRAGWFEYTLLSVQEIHNVSENTPPYEELLSINFKGDAGIKFKIKFNHIWDGLRKPIFVSQEANTLIKDADWIPPRLILDGWHLALISCLGMCFSFFILQNYLYIVSSSLIVAIKHFELSSLPKRKKFSTVSGNGCVSAYSYISLRCPPTQMTWSRSLPDPKCSTQIWVLKYETRSKCLLDVVLRGREDYDLVDFTVALKLLNCVSSLFRLLTLISCIFPYYEMMLSW